MGEAREPKPVKLFIGLLTAAPSLLPDIRRALETSLGPVESESGLMDFDFTTYYDSEMGLGIKRQFWGFRELVAPGQLPEVKLMTNGLEKASSAAGKRLVNLDPGYLTGARLVLASTKDFAHRLYLDRGIYGEVTLLFRDGKFEPLPWTYPDYRSGDYHRFFCDLRQRYLSQMREMDRL